MHIMVKMQPLKASENLFHTETPSWFWSTFEFNSNTGVTHLRDQLITRRAPLPGDEIATLLGDAGLGGTDFANYAPNGAQIRFTVDGTGEVPVIPGHTDMEDSPAAPTPRSRATGRLLRPAATAATRRRPITLKPRRFSRSRRPPARWIRAIT